ncbi:MAG TPA: OmpA family protein [bacterium]
MRAGLVLGVALVLAACATPPPPPPPPPARPPANIVLLLPDQSGKVGRLTVTNEGGSSTLKAAGTATRAADAQTAPTEPAPMPAGEVSAVFGDALKALPPPPLHFVLYFENATSELTAASRAELPAIVAAIRERASADTSVVGHADTAGDATKNLDLSLARARAVAALLTAAGVDPAVLEITSHGEGNLLVPTADNVPEPRNRRVEVTVR